MKTLKHTTVFLVTLILLITGTVLALTTSTVMARPKWEQRCSTLKPESGNEVKAPEFEVILGKDSVTVRGSSYISPGGIFNGVEWTIDLENCSYQTKRILSDKPADDNTVNDERWYEKTMSESEQAVTSPTGNYLAGIKIVTKDPPGYWLAATTHKLYWTTYSNGTVQWIALSKDVLDILLHSTRIGMLAVVNGLMKTRTTQAIDDMCIAEYEDPTTITTFWIPISEQTPSTTARLQGGIMALGYMSGQQRTRENFIGYFEVRLSQIIHKLGGGCNGNLVLGILGIIGPIHRIGCVRRLAKTKIYTYSKWNTIATFFSAPFRLSGQSLFYNFTDTTPDDFSHSSLAT